MFPLFPETDGIIEGLLSQCEYPYTKTKTPWRNQMQSGSFSATIPQIQKWMITILHDEIIFY